MKLFMGLVVVSALTASPSLAASYKFTIKNETDVTVTQVKIRGGKMIGSSEVPASSSRDVTVELPDGTCVSDIRMLTSDGWGDDMKFDFCRFDTLTIS